MSASSPALASLLRPRPAMLACTLSFAAIASAYLIYRAVHDEDAEFYPPGQGLRRSNAVHRRRRRNTTTEDSLFVDDQVENDGEGNIVARTLTDGETIADDAEYTWNNLPQSYQRTGQNIVQLLFRVSEDATRRNAYIHRGCACNSCGVVPIRGIRYRCANCADYDLCEGCEAQGMHTKTHIFYKIKVPAPSFGPKHIQPVWYSGDPDNTSRVLPKEVSAKLSRETGFERPELDAYWEQWTFMANTDWRDDPDEINLAMDRKTFEQCLVPSGGSGHTAPSLIFDRMFAFYDTNKDDLIGFPEFLHGIAYRKKKDKWNKIFEGYDIDGDGYVDRRDFLRMFRSYYVLYRQMHQDMLECVDEQQMSSTEAHQLVTNRQPLSSRFGQDGRIPRAPDPRTGEGKSAGLNGDMNVTDGRGILNPSGNDTGNREDIFRRDIPSIGGRNMLNRRYWRAMLNPPQTLEQLAALDGNLLRIEGDSITLEPIQRLGRDMDETEDESDHESDALSNPELDGNWPPSSVNITNEDVEAVCGSGTQIKDVRRSDRRVVLLRAIEREAAEATAYERWQRRQFYTDEEEGAMPPNDWKEEDDLLIETGANGESSKAPTRPTIHSRSSSRVRFADDEDDFDTRSNPSTSSRSVPERWGGLEIPIAERDAGKEILYQVTQQAFNELLDPLFRDKETLAVEAAETRNDRLRYRTLFDTPEFEQYALKREEEDASAKSKEEADIAKQFSLENQARGIFTANAVWHAGGGQPFPEVEIDEVREVPLADLLAATGYQIEETQPEVNLAHSIENGGQDMDLEEGSVEVSSTTGQTSGRHPLEDLHSRRASFTDTLFAEPVPGHTEPHGSGPGNENSQAYESEQLDSTPDTQHPTSPLEVLSIIAQYDDNDSRHVSTSTPQSHHSTPPQVTPLVSRSTSAISSPPEVSESRDATWPQFRPNSFTASQTILDGRVTQPTVDEVDYLHHDSSVPRSPREGASVYRGIFAKPAPSPRFGDRKGSIAPSKDRLYKLWQLEKATKEADDRGGWGRLSFLEFQTNVKKVVGTGKGNGMDYLGSWIEFCIP